MKNKITILAILVASLAARPAYCQVSSGTAVAPPNNHSSNDYPSPSPTLHPHDPTPPPSPSPTHRVPVLHASENAFLPTASPGATSVPHLVHGVAEATQGGTFSPDSSPTSSVHPIDPPGPTLSGIALAEPEPSTPLKPAPSLNPVVQPVEGHHIGPPRKILPPPSSSLRQAQPHNTGVIQPTPPFEPGVPPKDPTLSELKPAPAETPSADFNAPHVVPSVTKNSITTKGTGATKSSPLRQASPGSTGVTTPVPEPPIHPRRKPPMLRQAPHGPTPGPIVHPTRARPGLEMPRVRSSHRARNSEPTPTP
jgi:hypothetical protein